MRKGIGFLIIALASMMGDSNNLIVPFILILAGAMLTFRKGHDDV